jgi:hypothetical protein
MKERYFRPHDKTYWIEDHCHGIEVHPGVSFGGITLRRYGKSRKCAWTMTDNVFFEHLKSRHLVKI